MTALNCDFCGEPIENEPVRLGSKVYCSEACAFEATRSKDCAGRTDSIVSDGKVKPVE